MHWLIAMMMWTGLVWAEPLSPAISTPRDELVIPMDCKISPALVPTTKAPKNFIADNNLRHMMGIEQETTGKHVMLIGRVFDKNCVPVSNACIGLWQHDSEGNPPGKLKTFQGTGQACTDTNGHFSFMTVLPKVEKRTKLAKFFYSATHPSLKKPWQSTWLCKPSIDAELPRTVQNKLGNIILQPTLVSGSNTLYYYPDIILNFSQPFRQYQ